MSVCSICKVHECDDNRYCSSCESAIVKIGAMLQNLGVTADEALKALNDMAADSATNKLKFEK